MAQQHLDRLSATDASFLHQEGPASHMHVGGLTVLEGPPPPMDNFLEGIRSRLHLVPRYRQKLAHTALDSGRPVWVDDPNFNLEYHVRHTALPAPGGESELLRLVGRTFSQQLDRSRPLWELWLVEGLEGNRFGLISKTHHALVDGISGVDLATVMFDLKPVPAAVEHGGRPWQPRPEPGTVELVAAGLRGAVRAGLQVTTRAVGAAAHPERALSTLRDAAEGMGEIVWAGLNPAPETPLNVEIGPHRRFIGVPSWLADFRLVKNAFGGTVNDVVLAVVAGGMRQFLLSRGLRTEGLELRALVPVSVRTDQQRHTLGNQLAAMRAPLPVYIEDPVQRLQVVSEAMDGLKESKMAIGAEALANVQNFAPPTVLAQASRLNFSTRLFNLIVTNVPGPQFPLYVMGREMEQVFPVAFLPRNHAMAVAIMSYNGQMNFGLLADYDAVPDLDVFGECLQESLAELVGLAGAENAPRGENTRASNGAGRKRPAPARS